MLTPAHVRELALGLPEATEQDHHGRPSFRVRNRIFATLWTPAALNVMPGEEHIRAAVETSPDMCAAVYWGKRLRAVRVDLQVAESELVGDLLFTAWRQRVPRRLQAS